MDLIGLSAKWQELSTSRFGKQKQKNICKKAGLEIKNKKHLQKSRFGKQKQKNICKKTGLENKNERFAEKQVGNNKYL